MKLKTERDTETLDGNVDNTSNVKLNSELINHVEETPFAVVETEEGHIVVMGKYRMSEAYHTLKEAKEDAGKITWMRILQVIGATIENYEKDGGKK